LGEIATLTCTAELPLQLILIWDADCNNLQFGFVTGDPCETVGVSHFIANGAHFWPWVGCRFFTGWPESNYVLEACGIQGGAVPASESSWGRIKERYR